MKLVLNIEPKPQSRPKATRRGRHVGVYEVPAMMKWRHRCTELVKATYSGPYFDSAIKVDMTFYIQAPKKMAEPPSQGHDQRKFKNTMTLSMSVFSLIRNLTWTILKRRSMTVSARLKSFGKTTTSLLSIRLERSTVQDQGLS